MKKRMIIMLATVLVVVGGLGLVKYKQVQTAIAQASSFVPPPEAVTTIGPARSAGPRLSAPSEPCRRSRASS